MRWSACGPGRQTRSPPSSWSSNASKSPPGGYKCVQNAEVWGVVLVLFAWFCFGFDFFTVKQRKWGDKGGSARILLCIHDTTLPVQLRGSKDWGLQLIIFLLGSHEEMGPNYPNKCLMFYEAFTALHILTVFYCCFTNSGFKKVNADHNCCLAWKKYPTCLF